MARDLAWQARASCSRLDQREVARLFFGQGCPPKEARALCDSCPVFTECRAFADDTEHAETTVSRLTGFYAGETPRQRCDRRKTKLRLEVAP